MFLIVLKLSGARSAWFMSTSLRSKCQSFFVEMYFDGWVSVLFAWDKQSLGTPFIFKGNKNWLLQLIRIGLHGRKCTAYQKHGMVRMAWSSNENRSTDVPQSFMVPFARLIISKKSLVFLYACDICAYWCLCSNRENGSNC